VRKDKWLILGGGVTGLASAGFLQESGAQWKLLERCPTVGGLTRTIEIDRFCFDYTGHFLHLNRYSKPSEIPYARQDDRDWKLVTRRANCWIDGQKIPAPMQYHLGQLPKHRLAPCLESYRNRPAPSCDGNTTFSKSLVSGFGEYLSELFLIPQNEKTWMIPLDRLSPNAARRFFPEPDEARIEAGITGQALADSSYNSQFWYPLLGGINRLIDGQSSGLDPARIKLNTDVAAVDLAQRRLRTGDGRSFEWNRMLSSIPLRSLCMKTGDSELMELAQALSFSSVVTYNFGIEGPVSSLLEDTHWIYVPDPKLPFYRVGIYSNVSLGTAAPGTHTIYVECGALPNEIPGLVYPGLLQTRVINSLQQLGWIDPASIACCSVHTIPCAYVHLTPQREAVMPEILERLMKFGIYPVGRYGLWDYMAIEDSIYSGISETARLLDAD
jgi:protoporphyrinogen oxidase